MHAAGARKKPARAMTSSVNWVLLGLVIDRPSYGLELYNRFQRMYGDVLSMNSESHVYPALDRLKNRGLIEIVPGTGEVGRQPKLHYQATALGIRGYEDWLVAEINAERRRQELWVRQLEIFARDPAAALRMIGRFEREYLKGAGHTGPLPRDSASNPRTELINSLVAERQRIEEGGMVTWLQRAHDGFEELVNKAQANAPPRV
jgi:DNA-binding PadR family transcriptional regulator